MPDVNPQNLDLPAVIAALNHENRLRVVRSLLEGRKYVSALARDLQLSRPLLYLHLEKLESAGLIRATTEQSEASTGKTVRWYELVDFDVTLTPESVSEAAARIALERDD